MVQKLVPNCTQFDIEEMKWNFDFGNITVRVMYVDKEVDLEMRSI